MPQPRYSDLRRFCEIDGWEETTKRSRNPDHTRYRKVLDDGRVLRTKVSHGRGSIDDQALWNRIWREQLGLGSEEEFWNALRDRKPVDRAPSPPAPPSGPSKPGWLLNSLIFVAGLPEEEVERLSVEEATRRWLEFCEGAR
ncbi:MAG TPA: hypothetical protein VF770_00245 [Solirubrobacterales bacterium]